MASFGHCRAAAKVVTKDSEKNFNFSRRKRSAHVYEEDKHMKDSLCFIYMELACQKAIKESWRGTGLDSIQGGVTPGF